MNLFCLIISLSFVNVLAVGFADYKKEFVITNKHLELTGDILPDLIRNLVRGFFSMEKISYMVASPDTVTYRSIPKCLKYETDVRKEIYNHTSVPVPDFENPNIDWLELGNDRISRIKGALATIIANIETDEHFNALIVICRFKGLLLSINQPHAYTIRSARIDEANNCVLVSVNNRCYTLTAVWEPSMMKINLICFIMSYAFVDILAAGYVDYKKEFVITNKHLELVGDGLPEIIRNMIFGFFPMEKIAYMLASQENINYRSITKFIRYETEIRREIFKKTSLPVPEVENPDISWSELGNERISRIKGALETIAANIETDPYFALPIMVCRFKGLLLSIDQPIAYIMKTAKIDTYNNCILTSVNNNLYILNAVWTPNMASILQ